MKKFFLTSLFFFLFFLTSANKAMAAQAYITGCLRVKSIFPCYRSLQNKYSCLNENQIDFSIFGNKRDHIALIEGDGFPTGKDIYVVGCISTTTGVKCTSGDSGINRRVRSMGFVVLDNISGYEFKASRNPVTTQDGKVSLIVRSYTTKAENHLFYGIAEVTAQEYQGEARTITYGTFGFSDDPQKCISIRWDPKGRVFDSVSLEPLPQAKVVLLDENRDLFTLEGLENPLVTKEDGLFNFFVPNGTYYLKPEKDGYQFPLSDLSEVNQKYNNIYYCDPIVGRSLYFDQFPIVEENRLVHCDVPLKPSGDPYRGEVVSLDYGNMLVGNYTRFFGRFSHPLTIVEIKQGEKSINKLTTDKNGNWDIFVSNEKISSTGGEIEIIGTKNSIFSSRGGANSNSKLKTETKIKSYLNFIKNLLGKIFVKEIHSQTRSNKIILSPILRYIEGYAYNNKGEIIPKAIVNIITQMDGKIYSQTTADENGYFNFYSNQLPIFPYHLEIINPRVPNLKNTITTSQFIRLNKDYLVQNNINLITATRNNQLISTTSPLLKPTITLFPTNKDTSFINPTTSAPLPTLSNGQKGDFIKNNFLLIAVGLIFFLIILVGLLIFFYLKRKNTTF